jgi:hypothetical protein
MIWHLAAEDSNRDVLVKIWEWAKKTLKFKDSMLLNQDNER